jgi:hypothetical protein
VIGAEAALQAAMLEVLAEDEDVKQLLGDPLRVIDAGAPRPAYPYLEVVQHVSEPASGAGFEGNRHRIDLRMVSRDRGGVLARDAMIAVRSALAAAFFDDPPPLGGGWRCVVMAPVFADWVQMRGGFWRGLLRMKALVEKM